MEAPRARITLREVAKRANASISTVSRILNDRLEGYSYSPDMIERVRAAARDLGYSPNIFAQSLKSARSRFIGFSLNMDGLQDPATITDWHAIQSRSPALTQIFHGMLMACVPRGVYPMVLPRLEGRAPLRREQILPDGIQGVLYERPTGQHLEYLDLVRAGAPVVVLSHARDDMGSLVTCGVDDRAESQRVVAHALAQGARRFLFTCPLPRGVDLVELRLAGFRDALAAAGIQHDDDRVIVDETRQFRDRVHHALAADPSINCVYCAASDSYRAALDAAKALGRSVGRADLLVTSFSSVYPEEATRMGLTHLEFSFTELGYRATELLFGLIEGDVRPPHAQLIPCRLVEGMSTR